MCTVYTVFCLQAGVVSVAACSKHGTATTFAQEGAVAPCSQDGTTTLCYLVGAVMPCPLSQMLQLAPCVPMVSPWNGMENICPPPRFVSKSTSPIPYPQESAVAVSSLKENIASMKAGHFFSPIDMCTAECNSSQEANSSSYQLQLVSSTPLRINLSMAITQFLVWPFIYIDVLMLVTFSRKQAFRTETRYILFAHTLLVDLIFLLLTDFVVLISYSDVQMPMVFCIPVCMLMEMVTICTPMIITAMCVERYVAICMPLRHSALSTSSKTHTAILIIWTVSAVKPLMDVIILAWTVSQAYLSQLTHCYYEILIPDTWQHYMRGFLCIVSFIIIFLVELFCYVMIMLAARAASVDKKSAAKGLRTVSMHMLQLTLCTMEVICPYIEAVVIEIDIQVYLSVRFFNFVTFSVIARAVSPLVYGIRDEKFYTAFVYYMRCGQNHISSEHRQSNPAQK
ncbi:odorant receptor 131-2-like [Electrophorus electricus]|uniref:odorant receptor 131-2-like n=1 Tax=Electrophorus electricus TaxID=8005 RepID=UPI0015CFF741|nr:odorant receptor 131-2-like [Electrophorus electricus]